MWTARIKKDNETDEDGKRRVSMEKKYCGHEERSQDSLSQPNQNTILINIKLHFTRYGKVQGNSINKKQNGLE